ncbi:MAG: flagellin [Fibrobacter sp.]|nr:flagellin [Fibrobacter sp.]
MQIQSTGNPRFAFTVRKTESVLKKTNRELQKVLEKLSTASRINRASDDAAGLSISEVLRSRIRGFKMASRNIEDAMSSLNIADGAGDAISGLIQRQRELAVQARNGTLTDDDRAALNKEYEALGKEITRTAESARFNRQGVASGDDLASGEAKIQTGSESSNQIELESIDLRSVALGLSGNTIATISDAETAIESLDNAIKSIGVQRSTLGASVNRLQSSVNNLSVAVINTQAAESVIRDQDMAKGLSELIRLQLLEEGSSRAFSRFNEISQNHILGLLS